MNDNILHRSLMGGKFEPLTIHDYMTIEALEDGLTASLSVNACEYCIDGSMNWVSLPAATATPAINAGQTLSFRATGLTPTTSNGIGTFTISHKCNLLGNCMAMLRGDKARYLPNLTYKDSYCFFKLFYECANIISVSESFLPSLALASYCYASMFSRCESLVQLPCFPATATASSLCNNSYDNMFGNCTSLTTAENIIIKPLGNSCCRYMFYQCYALTHPPKLPATTLTNLCYNSMFYSCTSLVTAPELPATTLTDYCYESMFRDCTSLVTAPELPATTMTNQCYYNMFYNCRSLVNAPELPATTLAVRCYKYMFYNCTSLVNAPTALPATTLANQCYISMFRNCTNLTTAPELHATTLASNCYESMFNSCTSLVTAPELPATTLANQCYYNMFYNCRSLVNAPELPATTLAYGCYEAMFDGCTKLNYIKMLATNISASYCLSNWVKGVASTGTFVKDINAEWDIVGNNGVPSGWEVKYDFTPTECLSLSITADDVIGNATNTTIYYTAVVRGIELDGNIEDRTITGTAISDEFPQNTSETTAITRVISFTYLGKTATTSITQGVFVRSEYTVVLNDQWQLSSNIPNPDATVYDGVYESFSNKGTANKAAIMYIDISGYSTFQLYIRSYAESYFDYVMVSQLDQTIDNNTSYSNTTFVKAHTRANANSGTAISNYSLVEFTGIDGGTHRITVVYRKDGVGNQNDDRGYVLIPKNQ